MNDCAKTLLPCPFCGSAKVSASVGETGDGKPYPYIECEDCAATAEPDRWNTRAIIAADRAQRQAGQEPIGWMAFEGAVPLHGYTGMTEYEVKFKVLDGARHEGYKGTVSGRLLELGWHIKPLYAAPQPAPDGYKLVPLEPTDAMCLAATKVSLRNPAINGLDQYRAMLAAAPDLPR